MLINRRYFKTTALIAIVSSLLIFVTSTTAFADARKSPDGGGVSPSASSGSGGSGVASLEVEFSVSYPDGGGAVSVGSGGSGSGSAVVAVDPVCWWHPTRSGKDMAEYLDGQASADAADQGEGTGLLKSLHPDYRSHADDAEGRWYAPVCNPAKLPKDNLGRVAIGIQAGWMLQPNRFVPASQAPPAPLVDGYTLAGAAREAVSIPAPSVDYNPKLSSPAGSTVVGMDTWVWATGEVPRTVQITASAGGVSATMTITGTRLSLSAPDATSDCTGFGTPWAPGAPEGSSNCTITFNRSSANQPSQATPLTTSVRYTTAWTASDGTSGALADITTTSTTPIPVAEIQTINTTTPH